MASVELWFEFASTYSYPAVARIGPLAVARGLAITWRPLLLGPIFRAQGWNDSPFNVYPVRWVYHANFADDRDIADAAVLAEVLGALGQPAAELLARAGAPETKEELRRQTERATELGIFGAPTCVVGGELFWGNDRLEDAIAWATR